MQEPDTKSIEESTDDSPEIEYTEEELYRDAGLYEDSPLRISDIGTINHTNPIKNYTEVWCFLTNNTGLDLRTVEFYVMAWDNSGFPMKLYGNDYGFYYTQDNIPNGMVNLDCKTTRDEAFPTYMAIIPYSYESFDGTTWTNPLGNDGLYEMAQSTISQETMDSGGAWAIRKLDY